MELVAALSGLAFGLSLIVAIGAQNAFVLRQGLRGEHVVLVVAICAVSDAILIALGVAGAGARRRLPARLCRARRAARMAAGCSARRAHQLQRAARGAGRRAGPHLAEPARL